MMKEIITYDLRNSSDTSDNYYSEIKIFADDVLDYIESNYDYAISEYKEYLQNNTKELFRSRGEYIVEFLTLGMTWERYMGAAQNCPTLVLYFSKWLYNFRRSNAVLKPYVDIIRGWILGSCIVPAIGKNVKHNLFTIDNFKKLILWLEASGEFKDEVKRLNNWFNHCRSLSQEETYVLVQDSLHAIKWFRTKAEDELGKYTEALDAFLETKHKEYRYREDEIFTGKQPVEYYLNMVGAEIMNRGFAAKFNDAEKHALLVPGCMCIEKDECKARTEGLEITCTGCSKNCRVYELERLGRENNFEVYIVPHSSSFTKWLEHWQKNTDTGIIAVACLLNLVPGGYEMRELGLNAQCVLLDYCGCKKHWHDEGVITDLNENKILDLVRPKEILNETTPAA